MPGADPAGDLGTGGLDGRPQAEAVLPPVAKLDVEAFVRGRDGVAAVARAKRFPDVGIGPDRRVGLAVPIAPAAQLEASGPNGLWERGGYARRRAASPPWRNVRA
jgi:hypothetical protein